MAERLMTSGRTCGARSTSNEIGVVVLAVIVAPPICALRW